MTTHLHFTVTGLGCAGCVAALQKALSELPSVSEVEINLLDGRGDLLYAPEQLSTKDIERVVTQLGYQIHFHQPSAKVSFPIEKNPPKSTRDTLIRIWISIPLSLLVMLLEMHAELFPFTPYITHLLAFSSAGIVYGYCAGEYHQRTLRHLRLRTYTMDTLITLSTSVAFIYSTIRMLLLLTTGEEQMSGGSYFDVVGMITSFALLGKWLEERAKRETTKDLTRLISIVPNNVTSVTAAGKHIVKPLHEVTPGMRLLLRKGDRIPVDMILEGDTTIDESSITGEPYPQHKSSGTLVFSGGIITGEAVTGTAQKVGADSLLGKIIEAVQSAQSSKPPIQRLADTLSGYFVPAVLALALLTFLGWGIIGGEWEPAGYYAITVLVVACPCALGLATPTAIAVAMGKASTLGLFIKDAQALEQLSTVTDILFDKTGTLTTGKPQLVDTLWLNTSNKEALSGLIYTAEQHSSHPMAQLLRNAFTAPQKTPHLENLIEEPNRGIRFSFQNQEYRLGTATFLSEIVKLSNPDLRSFIERHPHSSHLYFGNTTEPLALFIIEDELLEDAPKTLQHLREQGLSLHLLSGDRKARVEAFAHSLGLFTYIQGEYTPLEKKNYIHQLQNRGRRVAMIGDGVNDTPALAQADLSIAIGTSCDIASEVAQVTSIRPSLEAIHAVFLLSRKTVRIIKENFLWAILYNFFTIPLAMGLFAPYLTLSPMVASAMMAVSSLLVVLNSLRLKSLKRTF